MFAHSLYMSNGNMDFEKNYTPKNHFSHKKKRPLSLLSATLGLGKCDWQLEDEFDWKMTHATRMFEECVCVCVFRFVCKTIWLIDKRFADFFITLCFECTICECCVNAWQVDKTKKCVEDWVVWWNWQCWQSSHVYCIFVQDSSRLNQMYR